MKMTRRKMLVATSASIFAPHVAKAWLHPGKSGLPASGNLVFNYIKDSTWTSNPNVTQYDAVNAGVDAWLNANFAFPACTIDLAIAAFTSPSIGESYNTYFENATITDYASEKAFLLSLPTDNLKAQAYGTLPGSDPSTHPIYICTSAHYVACTGGTLTNHPLQTNSVNIARDGVNGVSMDYTVDGSTCAAGKVSLFGLIIHEKTEVLGRLSALFTVGTQKTSPLDLFTWTASNTRSFDGTASNRYYSIDSGVTNTGYGTNGDGHGNTPYYCINSSGDPGGWGGVYQSPFQEQTGLFGVPGIPLKGDALQLGCLWPYTATGAAYAGI